MVKKVHFRHLRLNFMLNRHCTNCSQALLQAKLTKRFLPIREATYGIAFFATPHRGGQYGLLGELVAKVVRGEFGNSNNTLIESLKHDGIYSNELVENFREELEDLHVLSFYEDREFKDLGLVRITAN